MSSGDYLIFAAICTLVIGSWLVAAAIVWARERKRQLADTQSELLAARQEIQVMQRLYDPAPAADAPNDERLAYCSQKVEQVSHILQHVSGELNFSVMEMQRLQREASHGKD